MPVPFGLRKDAVFAFFLFFNADLVLNQTAEHIFALSNIDGLAVDADFINAWVLKLFLPPLAF